MVTNFLYKREKTTVEFSSVVNLLIINTKMKKQSGFTLIELIIVIVILGILAVVAAPKFIDLSQDAKKSTFVATGAAFKEGVKQVHYAWILRGNGQAVQNFIGDLSVNAAGYPADTRGTSLQMDSEADCLDVWRAVLDSQDANVELDDSAEFTATYNDPNSCTYTFVADTSLTVDYDANSGVVTINQ